MKKSQSMKPRLEPTLPTTPITIRGVEYKMCFDMGALAEAEQEMNAEGYQVNLLHALPNINLANTRILFAASIRKFHPDVSFEDALKLVELGQIFIIADAVAGAWRKSLPEPETGGAANPPKPGQ